MRRAPLWKISVVVPPEAEEAVAELLGCVFGSPPVSYTDARTKRTTVSAYLTGAGAWSDDARARLTAEFAHLRRSGLNPGPARITATELRHEDWAESWKRHFRAMEFGRALLVKPSWIRRRPRSGQQVVILDPGLSFGTGQHPTTAFCLRQLVARRKPGVAQSFLDIGTGSGILAIAAAKLGYRPVDAFDFDPDAVRVAKANARLNGVSGSTRISHRDLSCAPREHVQKYDIVCANLIHDVLLAERGRILARVCAGGVLVLAGILQTQFAGVAQAYRKIGFRLAATRREKEWRSGVFILG